MPADVAPTLLQKLLAAVADKQKFTKDDAIHALPNTSARRVDRALAALVKDGHIRKYALVELSYLSSGCIERTYAVMQH